MRPIPVSDEILYKFPVGAIRRVYASPSGDLTDPVIPPAEGILYQVHMTGTPDDALTPVVSVVIELEPGDLEELQAGGKLVIGWPGYAMPVFMVPWVLT